MTLAIVQLLSSINLFRAEPIATSCAIVSRWLSRASEDAEQRTFELTNQGEQFLVSSTGLRHVNIELDLVSPLGPAVRRSARGMTRAQSSGNEVLNRKYTLSIELERGILGDCA